MNSITQDMRYPAQPGEPSRYRKLAVILNAIITFYYGVDASDLLGYYDVACRKT